jgi:hypothetical protein
MAITSEDRHKGDVRGFIHSTQAWYRESLMLEDGVVDEVMFGFYASDGGTSGEMPMRWETLNGEPVPRLCVYDDAWHALYQLNDVLAKLANADGDKISPEEFCELLVSCGFVDMTERVRGEKPWRTRI